MVSQARPTAGAQSTSSTQASAVRGTEPAAVHFPSTASNIHTAAPLVVPTSSIGGTPSPPYGRQARETAAERTHRREPPPQGATSRGGATLAHSPSAPEGPQNESSPPGPAVARTVPASRGAHAQSATPPCTRKPPSRAQ